MENKSEQQILTSTFNLLKFIFVIVPIVAGAGKFINLLTNREQYINPSTSNLLPFLDSVFMTIAALSKSLPVLLC